MSFLPPSLPLPSFLVLTPTIGWFKFGGVEFFKINIAQALGEQAAWDNRTAIYLGASAMAEFIADIFLCPLEATRIRLVSNPQFANGLIGGAGRLLKEEGKRLPPCASSALC